MRNASDRLKAKIIYNGGVVVEKQKAKLAQQTTKQRNDLIDALLKNLGYIE